MHQNDRPLSLYTNSDLISELMERGVMRQYQATEIVPDAVVQRYPDPGVIEKAAMSKLVSALIRTAMMNGIIALGRQESEDAGGKITTFSAAIMTLDPEARMDDIGHGPLFGDTAVEGGPDA